MVVDEHSFIEDLVRPGGHTLDAGCRGFGFSRALAKLGSNVIAMDPDPTMLGPRLPGVTFFQMALVADDTKSAKYAMWSSGEGNHLCLGRRDPPSYAESAQVPCANIEKLMRWNEIELFDLVKLDIEGGEYGVLLKWPGPVSAQLSVEFHDFAGMNPCARPDDYYVAMRAHLEQWYTIVSHEKTIRNGISNYWDSLLVLKELA